MMFSYLHVISIFSVTYLTFLGLFICDGRFITFLSPSVMFATYNMLYILAYKIINIQLKSNTIRCKTCHKLVELLLQGAMSFKIPLLCINLR